MAQALRGMSDRALAVLAGYWDGLRDGRPFPMRAEIEPRGLGTVIDRVFLVSPDAGGTRRLRIVGQRLMQAFGTHVPGQALSAFIDGPPKTGQTAGQREGQTAGQTAGQRMGQTMRPSVETMGAAVRRVLDAVDAGHAVLLTLRPLQQARAASAPPSRDDDGPLGAGGGGRIRPGGDLPDVACLLLPLADRNGRPTHVIGALALDSWPAAAQASGFRVIDHVVAPAGLFQRAGTGADPRGAAQENAAAMPETRVPAAPPTAPFSTTLPATPLPAYAGARNPPAAPAASDVTTFGPGPTDTGATGAGPTGAGPTGAGATGADQDAFAESDRPWIGAPISAGGRTRLRLIRGGRRDQDTDADSRRKDA